jgi:hypothetical protein
MSFRQLIWRHVDQAVWHQYEEKYIHTTGYDKIKYKSSKIYFLSKVFNLKRKETDSMFISNLDPIVSVEVYIK